MIGCGDTQMSDNSNIASGSASGSRRATRTLFAASMVAMLSGCGSLKQDHVEVGAIPDDYRTNHPIVLQETEQTLDVPVSTHDSKLSVNQRAAVDGFVSSYATGGAGPIRIMAPAGSANEAAAGRIAQAIASHLQKKRAGNGYVSVDRYQASSADIAPVRLSYTAMVAQTDKCGRWPDDIKPTADNKHYANFGCSYQNNLAAQIANPADLLGPQGTSPVDAERRTSVIGEWRTTNRPFSPQTSY